MADDIDLPGPFAGPAAWAGPDMAADPSGWTIRLDAGAIAEVRAAAQAFLATGRDIGTLSAADFPLPRLAATLQALRVELILGRGFALVRALPVAEMTRAEAAAAFCGIGAHLGLARSQNAKGHILGHVTDLGRDPNDPTARIYQTHARQTFHTDGCDVVALLCLAEAKAGGDSLLVSGEAVWNEMRARRPDLLRLLTEPLATDRRGEVPEGANPWFEIPVFALHDGRVSMQYQRQYIDSAQRFDGAPRLTDAHVEALDLFDALCNDTGFNFRMRLAPGDMQFVYNHALLHDRTGFTDHEDPARRRHLLRLWLTIPGDRDLPSSFVQKYGSITPGDRGGIAVPGMALVAPLDPI
jgi:alpha-ketoglutarate-dependent taurine dioxygenase